MNLIKHLIYGTKTKFVSYEDLVSNKVFELVVHSIKPEFITEYTVAVKKRSIPQSLYASFIVTIGNPIDQAIHIYQHNNLENYEKSISKVSFS